MGQAPLTWPRQVLALVDLPEAVGVNHPDAARLFPADALRRAKEIKQALGGHGTGAYSHSQGVTALRQDVADLKRDMRIRKELHDRGEISYMLMVCHVPF